MPNPPGLNPPAPGGVTARLLVVDDEPSSRRLLRHALQHVNFAVETCASGAEALEILERQPIDLLVLDFEMPQMDGAELCARVRAHPNLEVADLPIILLTGHAGEDEEVRCLHAGANDFVTKPVSVAVLEARLQTQLRLRALRAELQMRNRELERWQREQEADLEAARVTQRAIVPSRAPVIAGWEMASLYEPLIQVGGDIFGWRALGDGKWLLWLADATGHGASAALYTTLAALLFQHAAARASSAAEILRLVNEEFSTIFRRGSFMSACCLVIHEDGRATYAGAGHPPMLIWRSSAEVETIAATGTLLGIGPSLAITETPCQLVPGDHAMIYTDGLYSLKSPSDEHFTPQDLATAGQGPDGSAANFMTQVRDAICAKSDGAPFSDDVCAIALRWNGTPARA